MEVTDMKRTILFVIVILIFEGMFAQLKQTVYTDGTQKLNGLVTANAGKELPGVLILPAWKGIDEEAKAAALNLQKQGYLVFVADIYGEGNIPVDNAGAAKIAGKYKTDYKAYQHRIELALDQLKKAGADLNKLAVIGYCFGGTGALEVARAGFPVRGVVCIHGGLDKAADRPNNPVTTKVLVEHPAEDKSVSPETLTSFMRELNESKADWQLITYAYCKHTFTNPDSPDYNEAMAKRAWQHTLLFLKEVLK